MIRDEQLTIEQEQAMSPQPKKKRPPTIARGAVIERWLIQSYLTRKKRRLVMPSHIELIDSIKAWIADQPRRTTRKGGIGR